MCIYIWNCMNPGFKLGQLQNPRVFTPTISQTWCFNCKFVGPCRWLLVKTLGTWEKWTKASTAWRFSMAKIDENRLTATQKHICICTQCIYLYTYYIILLCNMRLHTDLDFHLTSTLISVVHPNSAEAPIGFGDQDLEPSLGALYPCLEDLWVSTLHRCIWRFPKMHSYFIGYTLIYFYRILVGFGSFIFWRGVDVGVGWNAKKGMGQVPMDVSLTKETVFSYVSVLRLSFTHWNRYIIYNHNNVN